MSLVYCWYYTAADAVQGIAVAETLTRFATHKLHKQMRLNSPAPAIVAFLCEHCLCSLCCN